MIIAASDETTALTTGTAKVTFRMPAAVTLSEVRASLTTANTSGGPLSGQGKIPCPLYRYDGKDRTI